MNILLSRVANLSLLCILLLCSHLSQAQNNPNQTPTSGPEWKLNGNNSFDDHYLGTNNQQDLILKSNATEVMRLTSDQKTRIKGDFYLEQEISAQDTERKFMIIEPDGKVSAVTKSFLIHEMYNGTGCDILGDGPQGAAYVSPTWQSVPYSESYGYLITGNDCPARVGIGVENPLTQLHVSGRGYFTSNLGVGSIPDINTQINAKSNRRNGISINHDYAQDFGYAYKAIVHKKNTKGLGIINQNYDHDVFTVYGSGEIEASNAEGTFFNVKPEGNLEVSNADGNILTLQPNGKFTISNGTAKLIQVETDGLLRARKVKVDMQNWADYVFDKNYDLMPLNELDCYIQEHQHLPNVPSINTVIDEGIELGDMNRVLLEKIEELTLYIIEQNKELQSVTRDLEQIKSTLKNRN